MSIQLGDKVRDRVTGFTGITTARTVWISGCVRFEVQPVMDKFGKIPDSRGYDENQLELVKAAHPAKQEKKTGGPMPSPSQHAVARR